VRAKAVSVFRALVAKKELATKTQKRKRHTKIGDIKIFRGILYLSWDLLTTTILFIGVREG
jgi:hypothetical protein